MDTQTTALATTPFEEMERADEQMVLDEIKGKAIETLVYEVRGATGLSLPGVREVARTMNKNGAARIGISDKEPTIVETDDYFEVRVYAVDTLNGGGNWGIKRQPKFYKPNEPNLFALEQALSKAQRNAVRGLIPEWFVKQMIDAWKQDKSKVKTIERPGLNAPRQAQSDPANGKPKLTRPLTLAQLLDALDLKAKKARTVSPDVLQKQIGLANSFLQRMCDGNEDKRHDFLRVLQPESGGSLNNYTPAYVSALLDWMELAKDEASGKYEMRNPDLVKQEIEGALREALKAQGQQDLFSGDLDPIEPVTKEEPTAETKAPETNNGVDVGFKGKGIDVPSTRPKPLISAVQRRKLIELYMNLSGGSQADALKGLDAMFLESFKHPMSDGTYEEGAHITAQLLASQRAR